MSPGPVEDCETLVRFVEVRSHVGSDDFGKTFLLPIAVSRDDLRAKSGRSFSLARQAYVDAQELLQRAKQRTKESAWKENPVLARASTSDLRGIVDAACRREVCVKSDPISAEEDAIGPFPGHASAVRSSPPLDDEQRREWLRLRAMVGECFFDIRHADGSVPILE